MNLELRHLLVVFQCRIFEVLEDCFSAEQNHPYYPLKKKISLEEQSPKKRTEMGRNSTINGANPSDDILEGRKL